ncbi:AraC family transcriptional regulator [Pseudochryseolinea flava]|uniref:AraC family transcriptional regulator n=1 Tax=Pseudochryseolinea flava TaxID=2059302 RepID=A0A364Y5Y0_9BACT|nr:AraC family transcriptional regulator [Pseudochryseolinea flava]RAW02279.1 AraC family transcriptional regulator [Pseudochryseolinea flava]
MKILPFKIPKTSQESFRLQEDQEIHFYDHLHQHPEVQLTLILESEGKVIVGDFVGTFKPGDIFLIGPNLPHVFRNDSKYYQEDAGQFAHSITVFFEWQSFGEKFLSMPELAHLQEFSKLSARGLFLQEPVRNRVAQLMKQMFRKNGMDRLIVLLKILNILSENKGIEALASSGVYNDFDEVDGKKLADIYRFTMNEFHRKISLDEVASIAHMTTNSFCRYFKKRTRKSYVDFLTEIRIGQARKLLQQDDLSISQISLEVGFNNLSNFNRKFRELCSITPTEFRRIQENKSIAA